MSDPAPARAVAGTPAEGAAAPLPRAHPSRWIRPSPFSAAMGGLCPRCGAKTLLAGWLKAHKVCSACGLDFDAFNLGDGPAALVMMVVGTIVVPAALVAHFAWHPPAIVQILFWTVASFLLTVGGLRIVKGWLIAAEFQRGAREGRLVTREVVTPPAEDVR